MEYPKCLLCEQEGNSRVGAKHVPGYEFDVCWKHWEENWDGWNRQYEKKILEFLKSRGIREPRRDPRGMLPREYVRNSAPAKCI